MRIYFFCIILTISLVNGQDRRITSKLNPDCKNCTADTTLIYIRAEGSKDVVHQLWDFTRGTPTMIIAIGTKNSTLSVKWDTNQQPIMFDMSEEPIYSFAAAFNQLIEYNDDDDMGRFDPSYRHKIFPLKLLKWKRDDIIQTENEVMVKLHSNQSDPSDLSRAGIITVKLDFIPFKDYAVDLPHLIHTANSTLVDISLVNLPISRYLNQSRFALHYTLVSTDSGTDTMRKTMRKSLDDEHTPGVFEIIEIKTPKSYMGGDGGFIQFRPVAYTQPERGVTTSTDLHVYGFNRSGILISSTLCAYFCRYNRSNLLIQEMFVSFGQPGDGYYKQHNYTAWSYTIGYGSPPMEGFSLFVILVICIGLGVPLVLAISGVACVLARRCRQRNAPARFHDEE